MIVRIATTSVISVTDPKAPGCRCRGVHSDDRAQRVPTYRYMRQCHYIDGCPYDRLLFDLLAKEHKET